MYTCVHFWSFVTCLLNCVTSATFAFCLSLHYLTIFSRLQKNFRNTFDHTCVLWWPFLREKLGMSNWQHHQVPQPKLSYHTHCYMCYSITMVVQCTLCKWYISWADPFSLHNGNIFLNAVLMFSDGCRRSWWDSWITEWSNSSSCSVLWPIEQVSQGLLKLLHPHWCMVGVECYYGFPCTGICIFINPRHACTARVTVVDLSFCLSVRPLSHISPLERLFLLKTLSRTQWATKVKKFVGFLMIMLRCRVRAFPVIVRLQ